MISIKTTDINIRDPFVLLHDDKYYLYGTRSASCWGPMDGFDCYVSDDLENWSEPVEIFHSDGGFWADQSFWAPECYYVHGAFYLVATFGSDNRNKGIQILKSNSATGPFVPISDGPVTPEEWVCIDGTLYFDQTSTPYLIFSLTFETSRNGDMYAMKLTEDLTSAAGKPQMLFDATKASWAVPFPHAKDMGVEGDAYLTDGPFAFRTKNGVLLIIWSSWGEEGYAVGVARSESGEIDGPWIQLKSKLVERNGGHGMAFLNKDNEWLYTYHYPNEFYKEKPHFIKIAEGHDGLVSLS